MRLVAHIFTKLLQNKCLINTNILIYKNNRCNCKLWNALWLYCVVWIFSHIIYEHSYLKYYIFTKLLQIVCLINTHIYWHVRYNCKLWHAYWIYCFFWELCTQLTNIHVWSIVGIFTKLSLIVYLMNINFLIWWYVRYDWKLWHAPWIYCILGVFFLINEDYLCLMCRIFPKLSQIICLINKQILICWHARCDYNVSKPKRHLWCILPQD